VVLLFGTTGTGKSTIANALITGPNNIELKDGLYNVIDPVKHNGQMVFKIGHKVKSETKAPKFTLLHRNDS